MTFLKELEENVLKLIWTHETKQNKNLNSWRHIKQKEKSRGHLLPDNETYYKASMFCSKQNRMVVA
jgi:hypothetical protein